jgi:hypothetical protein
VGLSVWRRRRVVRRPRHRAGHAHSPPTPTPTPAPGAPVPGTAAGSDGVGSSPPPGRESGGHSDTNTQELGVDEADLVETDGQYIYTLERSNLVIVDADPAAAMSVVSRTAFEGDAVGIYLHGSRLTVLSAKASWQILPVPATEAAVGGAPTLIVPPSEPPEMKVYVTTFDVSDRAAPSQIEKTTFDGTYIGSRLIGDRLYAVINNDIWVPQPAIVPPPQPIEPPPVPVEPPVTLADDDGAGGAGAVAATSTPAPADVAWRPGGLPGGVYESEASYRARLEAMSLDDLLPGYTSTAPDGDRAGRLVGSDDAYVRDLADHALGQNLTTVALLNVGDTAGGPAATTTVAGFGGTVYASPDALYLASATYDEGPNPTSRLLKFSSPPTPSRSSPP